MEFPKASMDFLQWFIAHPKTTFHSSLEIVDLRSRHAGRGIVATADIPAETDLFTIPRDLIINLETSELGQKLPQLFSENHSSLPLETDDEDALDLPTQWLNLILVLLYETFHYETSRWKPYFSVLPTQHTNFDTLMFWNEKELLELQASEIRNKIGKESADDMFCTRIISVVHQHSDVFYPSNQPQLSDNELLERCHIIGSLIMSYAFDLEPDEDDEDEGEPGEDGWVEDRAKAAPMGMVPMADMLNADAEFNAHLSHGEDALTMTSLRKIKAGEEVLNYYGPLPNAELLRRYGYTSAKHARYDIVEVGWPLVKQVIEDRTAWHSGSDAERLQSIVGKVEEDNELDATDGFVLERESGDPDERGLCPLQAKFEKIPDELASLLNSIAKKMYKEDMKKRKASDDTTEAVLKNRVLALFERIAQARLGQYPSSIEEDEALLSSSRGDLRRTMAVEIRLGEKRLLQEALSWCRETQQKFESTAATYYGSSGNNYKKQKR